MVSTVNASEIVAKLIDRGASDDQAQRTLDALPVQIVPFDTEQAKAAGRLRRETRGAGLSLGDRACLSLALREGATVLTADRAWASLDVGVEIEVIR